MESTRPRPSPQPELRRCHGFGPTHQVKRGRIPDRHAYACLACGAGTSWQSDDAEARRLWNESYVEPVAIKSVYDGDVICSTFTSDAMRTTCFTDWSKGQFYTHNRPPAAEPQPRRKLPFWDELVLVSKLLGLAVVLGVLFAAAHHIVPWFVGLFVK